MTEETAKVRLGKQLAGARHQRRWTLHDVARRTARQLSRISELETGKGNGTIDSFASAGEALGLSLIYVPETKLADVLKLIGKPEAEAPVPNQTPSVYDEVFIPDQADGEEEEPPRVRR